MATGWQLVGGSRGTCASAGGALPEWGLQAPPPGLAHLVRSVLEARIQPELRRLLPLLGPGGRGQPPASGEGVSPSVLE